MKISIITLFPEMFKDVLNTSILKRAQEKGLIAFELINLRDFGIGKRRKVDDTPYGGGAGMVMRVDVVDRALQSILENGKRLKEKGNKLEKQKSENGNTNFQFPISKPISNFHKPISNLKPRTILLTPKGKLFNQKIAQTLSSYSNLILICGHYEGFDERVRDLVDEEISIGEYVLTGGEIPAMVIADAIVRLIPGVLGNPESLSHESFSTPIRPNPIHPSSSLSSLLEYPQYTRPPVYTLRSAPSTSLRTSQGKKIKKVPSILLSGDHAKITEWRTKQSLKRTRSKKR